MIITFANQKGGVGKTTLCILFANYLAKKGLSTLIIDADRQRSVYLQRKSESSALDNETLYNVEELDLSNSKDVDSFLKIAKNLDGYILIDSPGNLVENSLISIYKESDYILCPYQYEKRSLESTGTFIQVINTLKEKIPEMQSKLFFIPNHVDKRIGTAEENNLWNKTDEVFRQFGAVTPRVFYKACLMRISTLSISDKQISEVENCFEFILDEMKII